MVLPRAAARRRRGRSPNDEDYAVLTKLCFPAFLNTRKRNENAPVN
jgi:hypothetical protein